MKYKALLILLLALSLVPFLRVQAEDPGLDPDPSVYGSSDLRYDKNTGVYTLAIPLPQEGQENLTEVNAETGLGQYLTILYRFVVSLAVVAAVVMVMYGGIRYITSASSGGKGAGKETLRRAILGLILVLGSFLILYTLGGDRLTRPRFQISPPALNPPPEGIVYTDPDRVCTVTLGEPCSIIKNKVNTGCLVNNQIDTVAKRNSLLNCPSGLFRDVDVLGENLDNFSDVIDFINGANGVFTNEQLAQFYEQSLTYARKGYALSDNFAPGCLQNEWYIPLNMGQCATRASTIGIERGTYAACANEIARPATLDERKTVCQRKEVNGSTHRLLYVYSRDLREQYNRSPGTGCYSLDAVDRNNEELYRAAAETHCTGAGGLFAEGDYLNNRYNSGDPVDDENYYCYQEGETIDGQWCTADLEFDVLQTLGADREWDQHCNASNPGFAQDEETLATNLVNLSNAFSTAMGLGAAQQTSGYYPDESYSQIVSDSEVTRYHMGIDYAANAGREVLAPVSGYIYVIRDGWSADNGGWANNDMVAIVDQKTGLTWVFRHIIYQGIRRNGSNWLNVSNGSQVNAGDTIGTISGAPAGGDGTIFGPHLHLDVITSDTNLVGNEKSVTNNIEYFGGAFNGWTPSSAADPQGYAASNTMCPLQAYWRYINDIK